MILKFFKSQLIFKTILLFSLMSIHLDAANKFCDHCQSIAHKSENELCLRCGRLVKDCDYFHTIEVEKVLTYEDIVNAPNSNTLTDILFKLRNMYTAQNGGRVILSFDAIFKKSQQIFDEKGITLPEKGLKELKIAMRRRDITQRYLIDCINNVMQEGFEGTEECQAMLAIARNSSSLDEVEYPEKLRYGVILTWCGVAVSLLSEGALLPMGAYISGIGAQLTVEGMLEYKANLAQKERERLEKERIAAEKEAKRKQKEAKKKAEKEERQRKKEAEKQRKKAEKEKNTKNMTLSNYKDITVEQAGICLCGFCPFFVAALRDAGVSGLSPGL